MRLASGNPLQRSNREIVARVKYGSYKETGNLLVTDLEGHCQIVLGQPWLRDPNPAVVWTIQWVHFQRQSGTYTLRGAGQPAKSQNLTDQHRES